MESLLKKLCMNTTCEDLSDLLLHTKAAIVNIAGSSDIRKFESALVNLCCQNNNLVHWKHQSEKAMRRANLDRLYQVLLELTSIRKDSRERIVELLLGHVETHPSCFISLSVLFKITYATDEVLQQIRKEKFQTILNLLNTVTMKTAQARDFNHTTDLRKRDRTTSNAYNIVEKELAAIVKPVEFQEAPSTELTLKIPPLLLPSSKSISSSRYSFGSKQQRHRAFDQLFKLGVSLGQSSIGVELGCLLAKRRINQVNRFSDSHMYNKDSLQQSQTERDLSARGLVCEDMESIMVQNEDDELMGNHLRKSIVVLANILLLCAEKDYEEDEITNIDQWLPKIFDILIAGVIPHFNTENLKPKGAKGDLCLGLQGLLLSKQLVFGKLFNVCAMQSQNIQLIASFTKNLQSPALNDRSTSNYEISDSLLGKVSIRRTRINKKLLTKMGVNSLHRSNLIDIRNSSNKFILMLKNTFDRALEQFDPTRPKSYSLLTGLLQMLDNDLRHCESKIASYECIEMLMEHLLIIKRILLEMSMPFIKSINNIDVDGADTDNLESTLKAGSKFTKKTRLELSRIVIRPLIYEHPKLMSVYLSVIGGILCSQKYIEKLFYNVFIKNGMFLQLTELHTCCLFEEDQTEQILKVLFFYRRLAQVYHTRRLRNQDSKPAKTVLDAMLYLFNLRNGLVTCYLRQNDKAISGLLEPICIEDLNAIRKISFIRELLHFVEELYNYCPQINPLLQDDISSFYIKFAFINFVKLYSYLTVSELQTIKDMYESSDYKASPQQQKASSNGYYKQSLMVVFLQILINISANRTDEIAKKMRQYRILEFFTRELELQFCIRDYKHKLIKTDKPKSTDNKIENNLDKSSKKPFVPSLSLKTHKHVEEDPEEDKPTRKAIPPVKIPDRDAATETQIRQKQGYLDGLIGQITKGQTTKPVSKAPIVPAIKLGLIKGDEAKTKPQLALNLHNLDQLKQHVHKPDDDKLIYMRERRIRKIYSGRTIHSSAILLVLSLLLKKGLLDPLYCDQHPIMNGKINVLYILHHHLNHEANYSILSHLTEGVSRIKPYPAGQRLLKLLASPFTNMSLYTEWQKMSEGGYGIIFSCKTNLVSPSEVVVKQMNLPDSVYERCVLNDIFSEISCLENFRLDPKVTDVYDYGVTDNSYVIIMKRYRFSLRYWRRMQKEVNLPLLLGMFREILKVVKLLHEHSVTHYDIKADNILIDCDSEQAIEQGKYTIVFGDFGECKIYESEKQELDLRPRGTECNKSPEMLTVSSKAKKDSENYDRRRKVGTTKSSDIWSLGCLFFELMTGDYLFDASMWTIFFLHVTSDKKELITEAEMAKLGNNIYLIDFLKFILIREPQHRPFIDSIIKRFQNIYGLLVPNANEHLSSGPMPLQFNETLDNLMQEYISMIVRCNQPAPKVHKNRFGGLLKIMEDIYFCEEDYFHHNRSHIVKEGISHIIATFPASKFFSLIVNIGGENINTLPFRLAARVSDFLREVLIFKGKLLFVNNNSGYAIILLIYCLSLWFRCTIFETWCLINTQILQFPMSSAYLPLLSQALHRLNKIEEHIENLPKLQCICGSVTFILRRSFSDSNKGDVRICKCKKKSHESPDCPSLGCQAYLDFLKKRFNIEWDHLKWNLISLSNFLIGPFRSGKVQDPMRTQILINSAEPTQNMIEADPGNKSQWKVYKCKVCQMWMLSIGHDKKVWVLMNNLIKTIRQGIMIPNAQQNFKIRTPVLNNFTLSKLHMISQ